MEDWSELWLFGLVLGKALWYALAGGVIMGILDLASRYFLKGEDSKKLYPWALGASFLLGMFVQWQGMHHELAQLKKPQPVVQDEDSRKTIGELRGKIFEKESELQEAKRLKDRAENALERVLSEKAELSHKLQDKARMILEFQGQLSDKATRKTQKEEIAKFYDEGEAIKKKCIFEISESPKKDFSEWINRVIPYIKSSMDSSHATLFVNTLPTDGRQQYMVGEKNVPVSRECNDTALTIDRKLAVLKEFIFELSR